MLCQVLDNILTKPIQYQLPLLYACLNVDLIEYVLSNQIQEAYQRVRVLDAYVNPVRKVQPNIHYVQMDYSSMNSRLLLVRMIGLKTSNKTTTILI
jgi:hypothetical protein